MTLELQLFFIFLSLISGAAITALGPGGIFVTSALYALSALDPSTIAGTASLTFIAVGLFGSAAYLRSGQLRQPGALRLALILSITSIFGALVGAQINPWISGRMFGLSLGLFVLSTGPIVLRPSKKSAPAASSQAQKLHYNPVKMGLLGVFIGFLGGFLGVGGPVIAVPILVILGLPMLLSVGLAQVQSVFVSIFASLAYGAQGAIDGPLALLIGLPLLLGAGVGWHIAQRSSPQRLKKVLGVVLILLGLYLLLDALWLH